MGNYPENLGPLPVLKLCNRSVSGHDPNPVFGDGPLGNRPQGRDGSSDGEAEKLVKHLQKMLVARGYDLGDTGENKDGVDGDFGDLTKKAVEDFQRENKDCNGNQLKPDGLVGPKTADALNRAMVGVWYDSYQTPKELVDDKPYFTVTSDFLTRGLSIEPGGAEKAKLVLVGPLPSEMRTIMLDDPFLGILSGIRVSAKYSDGSYESLTTDNRGIIKVRANKGSYVDLEFATEIKRHQMRVLIVLDDVSTPKGAWQRLVNLGYVNDPQPPREPSNDDAFVIALEQFQAEHGIRPNGELDKRTQSALSSVYDSTTPWGEQEAATIDDDLAAEYDAQPKDAVA